jgi:DNA-binding transcriptional regulator/RsmH inhibitor MraZ
MSGEVTRSTKVLITAARLDPSGRVSIASSKRRHAKLVPICKYIGSLRAGTTFGRGHMHEHSDYLRDQATKFWELAAQANDPVTKQELCELARVCEEVADDMDDRRVSG